MKYLWSVVLLLFAVVLTEAQLGDQDVPAFHKSPPAKGEILPAVLTEKQLAEQGLNQPVQIASYKAVAKASGLIYQLPCYCHCDRAHGHTSLHSCFERTHGAVCGTCIQEALYAYKMSKQGWTAKMIRDGIIKGDWKQMDLQHPEPVK